MISCSLASCRCHSTNQALLDVQFPECFSFGCDTLPFASFEL